MFVLFVCCAIKTRSQDNQEKDVGIKYKARTKNPALAMGVCLVCLLCKLQSLLRADHLSRGVISSVCVSLCDQVYQ